MGPPVSTDEPASPPPSERPPPGVGMRRRGNTLAAKLLSVTILANLGGFLAAIWIARLVRAGPETEAMETGLRVAYYGSMLVVALVEAFLLDEVLFKGAFRKTQLQGRTARYARPDEDVHELAASMQRSTVSFPFTVLACVVVTYLAFNAVNHDFDTYYRRVGKHISALRGDAPETRDQRLSALSALSIRREPEVLPRLRLQLQRGGEVGAWSAWSLGRFTDLPNRRPLWAPLVAAARSEDPRLRREALVALGRLQHRSLAGPLQDLLEQDLRRGEPVDLRVLYGLGSIQTMSSVDVLEKVLHQGDDDAQRMAGWALAQHRDQRGGRAVVGILEERLPSASFLVRCGLIHALGILADEASNLALMAAYDEATPEERVSICPSQQVFMRPDGQDDQIDLLMPQDILALKVILSMGQMRATSSPIRAEVEPWLKRVLGSETATPATREAAHNLLSGIVEGRDDSKMKTVDEAFGGK